MISLADLRRRCEEAQARIDHFYTLPAEQKDLNEYERLVADLDRATCEFRALAATEIRTSLEQLRRTHADQR